MPILDVPPLRWYARLADGLMKPVMYLLAGTMSEEPQSTHYWNNKKFPPKTAAHLDRAMMCCFEGLPHALSRRGSFLGWSLPRFHMPIFGGWNSYVVLEPASDANQGWHIGWLASDLCGVSRVLVHGPVRVLRGDGQVRFFGINANSGKQIPLQHIGSGTIGDGGPYCKAPVL